MSARDGLFATGIGSLFAILADIVINGGEVLLLGLLFLTDFLGPMSFFLGNILSAAPVVPWLPVQEIRIVYAVISLGIALVFVARFVYQRRSQS